MQDSRNAVTAVLGAVAGAAVAGGDKNFSSAVDVTVKFSSSRQHSPHDRKQRRRARSRKDRQAHRRYRRGYVYMNANKREYVPRWPKRPAVGATE